MCGQNCQPHAFGMTPDGTYDPAKRPAKLVLFERVYGGRARITMTERDVPAAMALGLRAALKDRLAFVEAELRAAGVEFDE